MNSVKNVAISEFKQKCLELLDPEALSLEPLAITRHNKVVARIIEPESAIHDATLKGSVQYHLQVGETLETLNFSDHWNMP